jgi:alanine dehydrogenase
LMPQNVFTLYSNAFNLRKMLGEADLLIGAVLVRGDRAPVLVTREMLGLMKPRAVIVDVAVDQGGCVETIRPTTHSNPIYMVDGIVHYGVANMPGAVAGTSTYALTNVTLPYLKQLADRGWRQALQSNPALCRGLNVADGKVAFQPIADLFGLPCSDPADLLNEPAT